MDVDENKLEHYQSFADSYKIESQQSCDCDYCLNTNDNTKESKQIADIKTKLNYCMRLLKGEKTFNKQILCKNSIDHSDLSHENSLLENKENSGLNYFELWQSELFKAKAFEKDNERLEKRVKYFENKLEKETHQQIRISLEWRKTVMKLVDENKRLKLEMESSEDKSTVKNFTVN